MGFGNAGTEESKRDTSVADELLALGEELYVELKNLSIEAPDVKRQLDDARNAISKGNMALATIKATDACTLAEQKKSEGIIRIVGSKINEIKDFIRTAPFDYEIGEVKEYLGRGEDALILGHHEEANQFLDIARGHIFKFRRQLDTKKITEIISKADLALEKEEADPDGQIRKMLMKSKAYMKEGDLDRAGKLAYNVLNKCSEESQQTETRSLWEEFGSMEDEIEELERFGAEVTAVNIRLRDGKKALKEGNVDDTRGILSNCYAIIGRLKDRVKIRAAQEKLSTAKYMIDHGKEIDLDMGELEEGLSEAQRFFQEKEYERSIERSDDMINRITAVKDNYYREKIMAKIDQLKENIAQLEESGLGLETQKKHLAEVSRDVIKKKYLKCENMLDNIALELLKEKNNLRIKIASSEISVIQADIRKIETFGIRPDKLNEILEEAQQAFNDSKYHLIEESRKRAAEITSVMIRENNLKECKKEYDEIEGRMTDLTRDNVDISKAWDQYDQGRKQLLNGEFKQARATLKGVREILNISYHGDMEKKIREVKDPTIEIIDFLKEQGLKMLEAEKLLRMAELKLEGSNVEEGYALVQEAHDSAEKAREDFLRKKYLDRLLEFHSEIKALARRGVDVSSVEEKLKGVKEKIQGDDFPDMDVLFDELTDSMDGLKQEYKKGLSLEQLMNVEERIADLKKKKVDIGDIEEIIKKARTAHDDEQYSTVKSLIDEANMRIEENDLDGSPNRFQEIFDKLTGDVRKWKDASLDTTLMEVILAKIEKNLKLDNLEKVSQDVDRATEMASKFENTYYQERVLDIISESKISFRELMEASYDVSELQEQLNTINEHLQEQLYREAFELAEDIDTKIIAKKRSIALTKRKQPLLKQYVELEEEGLELTRERERFSYVDSLIEKGDFSGAEVILEKLDEGMKEKFREYKKGCYSKEIDEFKDLMNKFSEKGVDISSLHSFMEKATFHLEMNDFETAGDQLKTGWKEAESLRDFYVSNKLISRLYELEDVLFELANRGADVKRPDAELLRIKKMISRGRFDDARTAIENVREEVKELEKEFNLVKFRTVLAELEQQRMVLEGYGVTTTEMKTLIESAQRDIGNLSFHEVDAVIEKIKKIRDAGELGSKVKRSQALIDNVGEEIGRLKGRGIDVVLMADLYDDARTLLAKNNFNEVEAYCKLAMKEGRMKEGEADLRDARERLQRSKNVMEFIRADSEDRFDLSEYYSRVDELSGLIEEGMFLEVKDRIPEFEDDVRKMSLDYMKHKAVSTKNLLMEIISEIDEIGGVTSTLMAYVKKGDKLFEKEHYGPCIEWFQKGMEKAAFEKRYQDIRLSKERVASLLEDARTKGVDVSEGSIFLNEAKKAFASEDYDRAWDQLDRARNTIEDSKLSYQRSKIRNLISSNNLIYEELITMIRSEDDVKVERSLITSSEEHLSNDNLDEAEECASKAKEELTRLKSMHNLRTLLIEYRRIVDLCGGIEEQGVEISSSNQLLEEVSRALEDKTSLSDDEYGSLMDDIEHALEAAKQQEFSFKKRLLADNLEKDEALIRKFEMEGADMSEPRALLNEAAAFYEKDDTENGLAKIERSITLAEEIQVKFFKDSADGLMYTAELLLADIHKLPTNTDHLDAMLKIARENYSEEKFRECVLQLKSLIGTCDETTLISGLETKVNELVDSIYRSPLDNEYFEEQIKDLGDSLAGREFDRVEELYEGLSKRYGKLIGEHDYARTKEKVMIKELTIKELGADGIDQSESRNMIELSMKYIEDRDIAKARETAEQAVVLAKETRTRKINEICEAVLQLEDTIIEEAQHREFEDYYLDRLREIRNETDSHSFEDLTKTIMSFNLLLRESDDYGKRMEFIAHVGELRALAEQLLEYLPKDIIKNIDEKLEGLPVSGVWVPASERNPVHLEMKRVEKELSDAAGSVLAEYVEYIRSGMDRFGGKAVFYSSSLPGIHAYKLYLRKYDETPKKDVVTRLRLASRMKDQLMEMERRKTRKKLNDECNRVEGLIGEMESDVFSPTSAKHWLKEARAALERNRFAEVGKCLGRAEDGAGMARKRYDQESASRRISSTIKRMKAMGLIFSQAEGVRLILKKAQEAEKKRDYNRIDELCAEAIESAKDYIAQNKKDTYGANIKRVEDAIRSEAREIDQTPYLNKLDVAKTFYDQERYDVARKIAKNAENDMRQRYWLVMVKKLAGKYGEAHLLLKEARAADVDISLGESLVEESKRSLRKDALAFAEDNIDEAISMITELTATKRIRDFQDEAIGWRKELEEIEKNGGGVVETGHVIDRMLGYLKKGEVIKAEEIKVEIEKNMTSLRKDVFRIEVKGTLEKCDSLMKEVGSMKGDTAKVEENIKKAVSYMSGDLLESASEISRNCLKELADQRNILLEDRASTVLYAAGEIIKGMDNEKANEYYKKAQMAYRLERYKEAMTMAQESLKHVNS